MGGEIDLWSEPGPGSPLADQVPQKVGMHPPHDGLDVEDFFDRSIFNSIIAGLPEETCKLALTAFADELSSSARKVRQAAKTGNHQALEEASHSIIGVAGTFGASVLQSAAKTVNRNVRGGEHQQALQQAKDLATICDLTLGALKRLNGLAG